MWKPMVCLATAALVAGGAAARMSQGEGGAACKRGAIACGMKGPRPQSRGPELARSSGRPHDPDAEGARLVDQIAGDAGSGEGGQPDRELLEEEVVPAERRRLAVAGPVGLEHRLCDPPVLGSLLGDQLGTFR